MDYVGPMIRDRVVSSLFSLVVPLVMPSVKNVTSWALTFVVCMVIFEWIRTKTFKETVLHVLFTTILVYALINPTALVHNTVDILQRTDLLKPEVLAHMREWGSTVGPVGLGCSASAAAADPANTKSGWIW